MRHFFFGPYHGPERRICPRMGRFTRYALYVAVASAIWGGFKHLEPLVLPVVKDFEIVKARLAGYSRVEISGSFNKVRNCEFIDVIGYSGKTLIRVSFNGHQGITRMTRDQRYGPWILEPEASQVELYSRHRCATGEVLTKLFDGAIAL